MNQSNWEHVAVALIHQVIIGLAFGNWWAGAALGAGIFIGREFAQCEQRILMDNKWNTLSHAHSLKKYPELMCYQPKYWNLDSVLDTVMPTLACVLVALVMYS